MLKMTEASAIALHSLIYIAGRKEKVSSLKEIAKKFDISENHLSKVLQRLVKEGIITSSKGPKGGFLIVPRKRNISFLEVYEIIEGRVKINNCLFNSNSNSNDCSDCIMDDLLTRLNNEFISYMKTHKISDFSF
ncbi:MAG: Rrf2 family transcriptional regulator [Candidatus Gastranaerophilales bacterium]|nr:Rrf2 family transcriptional regulator [Candidatus Gastranaerophilales bacterium]